MTAVSSAQPLEMKPAGRRLLIMAAGTGGHIFPGLAIAREMQQRGWQVSWLGTTHGMENDLVPPQGLVLDRIAFSGVRGKGLGHSLRGVFALVKSYFSCRRVMQQRQPDLIVGMGGYVTVPGGLAAATARIPLVLVNADAGLLMSNKMLLPVARKILFGFDGAGRPRQKSQVTGNPVRAEISSLPAPAQRFSNRNGALQLLVVGGSLGAQVLNRTLPAALALLSAEERPQVTHQSGKQHIDALRAAYSEAGVEAELVPFIDDMPRRYAGADLVICRAGAISVSELCAAGVASVLVPFVASTTSHQIDNAEYMAAEGAAVHLRQQSLNPAALAALLKAMTRERCQQMAEQAYRIGRRDANTVIANELEQLAGETA